MRTRTTYFISSLFFAACFWGCSKKSETVESSKPKVPVSITHPKIGSIEESLSLTAISSFQRKNIVAATMQGYVLSVGVNVGDHVTKGQPIFQLQTKESHAISDSSRPSTLKSFSGKVSINASASGVVTSIMRQAGDYVQDGEQLCTIADIASFAFVLNVPYDYNKLIKPGNMCSLTLPDSTCINARIGKKLSSVDATSQTQNYLLTTSDSQSYPENIIAQVKLPTHSKAHAVTLLKQAVLSDETLEHFWVMMVSGDSLALRIPIAKGIQTDDAIEILSPQFSENDSFVLTGNYGMEDSTHITIIH